MRTILYAILFSSSVILTITGCEHQNEPADSSISGSLTGSSDCKIFKSVDLKFTVADTFSCVQYQYNNATLKLNMTHINAGFNCCPGEIFCDVSVNNDTIIIAESEKEQSCNCLCLFDLDIELQGVDEDIYIVKFIEPYAGDQEKLIFEMDLTSGTEGEFCVIRKGEPWGY
jgi:hypothetical protein